MLAFTCCLGVECLTMARPVGGRLSEAFRQTYQAAGLTQTDVATRLQGRGWDKVDQSLVSKWARGMARPSLEVLPDLDAVCGVPLGHILREAGFVADTATVTVEQAIKADPALTPRYRREVLSFLDYARVQSAEAVAK